MNGDTHTVQGTGRLFQGMSGQVADPGATGDDLAAVKTDVRQFVPPLNPGDLQGDIVLVSRDNWDEKKDMIEVEKVSVL